MSREGTRFLSCRVAAHTVSHKSTRGWGCRSPFAHLQSRTLSLSIRSRSVLITVVGKVVSLVSAWIRHCAFTQTTKIQHPGRNQHTQQQQQREGNDETMKEHEGNTSVNTLWWYFIECCLFLHALESFKVEPKPRGTLRMFKMDAYVWLHVRLTFVSMSLCVLECGSLVAAPRYAADGSSGGAWIVCQSGVIRLSAATKRAASR